MTARARITQAELVQAAALAKTEGVSVTITTPNGKTYTIAPVDALLNPAHGFAKQNRAEIDSCADAMEGDLSRLVDLATDAGWQRGEVMVAILSLTVTDLLSHAGADVTLQLLADLTAGIRAR